MLVYVIERAMIFILYLCDPLIVRRTAAVDTEFGLPVANCFDCQTIIVVNLDFLKHQISLPLNKGYKNIRLEIVCHRGQSKQETRYKEIPKNLMPKNLIQQYEPVPTSDGFLTYAALR